MIVLCLLPSTLIPELWVFQISGNFGVAKDALAEIASRLRVRTLRDATAGAETAPVGPAQRYGRGGSMSSRGLPPSGTMGAGNSGRYDPLMVHFLLCILEVICAFVT